MLSRIVLSLALLLVLPASLSQDRLGHWEVTRPKPQSANRCTVADNPAQNDSTMIALSLRACKSTAGATPRIAIALTLLNEHDIFKAHPDEWQAGQRVLNSGIDLSFRFDEEKPYTERWAESASGDALKTDTHPAVLSGTQFLDKLQAAKQLTVTYTLETGASKSAIFLLEGANQVVAEFCAQGCDLANEKPKVPMPQR